MKLLEKLLTIQRSVDAFVKDGKGYDYDYVQGNQVLGIIRPLMNELGLLLKQEVLSSEHQRVDYSTKRGDKSEMFTSTVQLFTWIDTESNEREEVRWHANGLNAWDKGLGSALTYGERYFLLKFFHVPTDADDPDKRQGEDSEKTPKQQAKQQPSEPAKPIASPVAFEKALARYNAGEKDIFEKTRAAMTFTPEQEAKIKLLK